ncbi:integrase [Hydrogenophaga sp. PAMC20947]|nr:integrase [Hydrogenophaga sp. PAMC20947]
MFGQVREHIHPLHFSYQTEKAHRRWIRFSIRWQGREGVMRHPRKTEASAVEGLANHAGDRAACLGV